MNRLSSRFEDSLKKVLPPYYIQPTSLVWGIHRPPAQLTVEKTFVMATSNKVVTGVLGNSNNLLSPSRQTARFLAFYSRTPASFMYRKFGLETFLIVERCY